MHRTGRYLGVVGVIVLVAGCLGPGRGIAERIRAAHSPIVQDVILSPTNPFGGRTESIAIYVVPTTTPAQALALWCDVVLPAGGAQLDEIQLIIGPPEHPTFPFPYNYNPVCPASPSSPPSG